MARKRLKKEDPRSRAQAARKAALEEFSLRIGVKPQRLKVAVQAAEQLEEPEFGVLEALIKLADTTPRPLEVRRELSAGLRHELERLWMTETESDPLAELDEPLDLQGEVSSSLWADTNARLNRARLLADCVSSKEAGEMTGRSRQAVERQRREGGLLALRAGREWRYPKWQFDIDGPGGLVPGLGAVIGGLRISPYGAALWLSTPKAQLADKVPADLLRRRQTDQVVALAEEHGHMP